MQALTTGQVADQAGWGWSPCGSTSARVCCPSPPATDRRHRRHDPDVVARIRFMRGAQDLGFGLREIEELLALRLSPGASKAEVRAQAEAKVAEIERKMSDLQRMRDPLLRLIGACGGTGPVDHCPILEALDRGGP